MRNAKPSMAMRALRKPTGSQSFERAVAILRIVAGRADGLGLSDIASEAGLKKATVHRLLRAMQREGFVDQDEANRSYRLGPEMVTLGALAASRFNISKVAAGSLMRLSAESQDSVYLSVPRGADSVILERVEGDFPIRTQVFQVGVRNPLGVGAGSLAMLAAMPDAEIEEIVEINAARVQQRFPNFSPPTIRRLVQEARLQGYAVNEGLVLTGSWGVGAAVLDGHGRPVAAVSVGAIEARLRPPRQEKIGELLRTEARELGAALARP